MGLEAARALDDKECWERLADAALALGNHQVHLLIDRVTYSTCTMYMYMYIYVWHSTAEP